jgi:hypothetical protein
MMLLLDTHIWLWSLAEPDKAGAAGPQRTPGPGQPIVAVSGEHLGGAAAERQRQNPIARRPDPLVCARHRAHAGSSTYPRDCAGRAPVAFAPSGPGRSFLGSNRPRARADLGHGGRAAVGAGGHCHLGEPLNLARSAIRQQSLSVAGGNSERRSSGAQPRASGPRLGTRQERPDSTIIVNGLLRQSQPVRTSCHGPKSGRPFRGRSGRRYIGQDPRGHPAAKFGQSRGRPHSGKQTSKLR